MRPTAQNTIAILLLALVAAPACTSSGTKKNNNFQPKTEPYVPLPDEGPQSIGYFLTVFDRSLLQWSELKLSVASTRDRNELTALEANMTQRAKKRRDELVQVLESGSPANRRVAAAALGFSRDPTVLGPLTAVLADRDPEVVQKALLGLGVLAHPDTPVGALRPLLLENSDPWTRNNAAFTLLSLARAGSHSSELAEICRAGLGDVEPGVRAQCASTLGTLADGDSAPQLAALLTDEANLVALASAMALANVGRAHPALKGTAARALAGGLDTAKPDRRTHLLGALRWLAQDDLGEDARPWHEWAFKLP